MRRKKRRTVHIIIPYYTSCPFILVLTYMSQAGSYSSVSSDVTWESRGTAIDPRVQHIFALRFGHEIISTAILPLPLIQEEQLSFNGERMCAKYWLPASGRLAQEQGG